jgi:hypothetical protein
MRVPSSANRALSAGKARQALIKALEAPYESQAEAKADHLLGQALRGSVLDVSGQDVAFDDLPPEAWAALQLCAQDQGHEGITQVNVANGWVLVSSLVDGFKQLPTLERLDLELLERSLDLGDLRDECPRLERVNIVGNVPARFVLMVPAGVRVTASHDSEPSLYKSRVFYRESDGQESSPRPLHGQIYDHTSRDFGTCNAGPMQQFAVRDLNLNGEAMMQITDRYSGKITPEPIMCRHLAMTWLNDRAAYQAAKVKAALATVSSSSSSSSAGQTPDKPGQVLNHFSYDPYMTGSGISAQVPKNPQELFKGMEARGASALFEPDLFGAMVADQLAGMEPGEFNHFAVVTANHMLGVELRVKERRHGGKLRREYVVNLYDPNATATHQRLVVSDLSQLRGMKLANWIPRAQAKYFPENPAFGALYRWPTMDTPVPAATYVSEASRATGGFLHASLWMGQPAQVRQAVGSLVAKARSVGSQRLESQLLGIGGVRAVPGLNEAMVAGRSDVVVEYVNEILGISGDLLDRNAKYRVLRVDDAPVLAIAIVGGSTESVTAYARAILEAPNNALTEQETVGLLLSTLSTGPILAMVCGFTPEMPLGTRDLAVQDSIRAYIRLIANSRLGAMHKIALCNPALPSLGIGAARFALIMRNPGAAAAILLGILESDADVSTKHILLARLAVAPEDVMLLLRAQGDPKKWAPRIGALVRDLPLPPPDWDDVPPPPDSDEPLPRPALEEAPPPPDLGEVPPPPDSDKAPGSAPSPVVTATVPARQTPARSGGMFQRMKKAFTTSRS